MWLLAQTGEGGEPTPLEGTVVDGALALLGSLSSLIYFAFLIWMVLYCLRRDPERGLWLWVLLIFQPLGPLIYFFVRYLPSANLRLPVFFKRWSRSHEIRKLEIAALQIGNAHQFIQWGEALLDVGQLDAAGDAFRSAIAKEPDNLPALWGSAQVDFRLAKFSAARTSLAQVLAKDARYKFGDVSLLYGKTLNAAEEFGLARDHLIEHVRQWRQPEGLYLLAELEEKLGQPAEAKKHLEAMLLELEASPPAIARRHVFWRSRARRMLRRLK